MAWDKLGDSVQDVLLSIFRGLSGAISPIYGTLLSAVTGTGAGTAVDVSVLVPSNHTWAIQVTGAVSVLRVDLEGALNDVDAQYGLLDSYEGTTSTLRTVSGKAARYVRANVVSLTPDTGTPTVSAQYIGCP